MMGSIFLLDVAVSSAYFVIKMILLGIVFLCALYLIFIILAQPSNSSGIGAIGGSSETFLSKNKSRTKESRDRRRTIFCAILLAVALIAYAIVTVLGRLGIL